MQLEGPTHSMQFSTSPRRRARIPWRAVRFAWTRGGVDREGQGLGLAERCGGLGEPSPVIEEQGDVLLDLDPERRCSRGD